jgi:NADH dehydrogenase
VVPLPEGGAAPDTAQFALRQGILLGKNIAAAYRKEPLQAFAFKGQGELASIGHHVAVADVFGFKFAGFIAWWFWRTIYVAKLPRFDRKVRVVLDWTLDLFFPRDLNMLSPRYSTVLQEIHLEPGDYVLHHGEPAFSLYIVKSGRIEISDESGVIRVVTAGEYFGERALLADHIWQFDGHATEPTTLVSISAEVFHQIVDGAGSLSRLFSKSAGRYYSREIVKSLCQRLSPKVNDLLARDIMHRETVVLKPDMPLREVMGIARTHPHSSYPVVSGEGILGVVHREDFYEFLKRPEGNGETQVKQFKMSALPIVAETCPVPEIVEHLVRSGENKVLVENKDHQLAGIVTVMDLLNLQADASGHARV